MGNFVEEELHNPIPENDVVNGDVMSPVSEEKNSLHNVEAIVEEVDLGEDLNPSFLSDRQEIRKKSSDFSNTDSDKSLP